MVQQRVQLIKKVREELTLVYERLSSVFSSDEVIYDLMRERKYGSQEMFDTLKEIGVFRAEYITDIRMVLPHITDEQLSQFGFLTENGDYLMPGRYVLPIRDIDGTIMALVGWHPMGGDRKYVTTPTLGFSRDASFFNMDSFRLAKEKFGGKTFLVEGIFDSIALRSIGIPAIGNQGLELSPIKTQILNRYEKIIALPDNDNSGRKVNPFTNFSTAKSKRLEWRIEAPHVFVKILDRRINIGEGEESRIKDIDVLIREYDAYDDLVALFDKKFVAHLKVEA